MSEIAKIEIKNLTKIFGKNPQEVLSLLKEDIQKRNFENKADVGLNNINFDVYDGEIFVLMGLSGPESLLFALYKPPDQSHKWKNLD